MNEVMTRMIEFIKFVGSKPADEEYDYSDSEICPLAQFGEHLGYTNLEGGSDSFFFLDSSWQPQVRVIPSSDDDNRYVTAVTALSNSRTFGELHAKLAELYADELAGAEPAQVD